MISAQFRIRLPDSTWVAEVSRSFPDATFKMLSGYRLDEKAIELGETVTDEPDACARALRDHPAITRFELLESGEGRLLTKYETTDTALYEFVEASSLPVEFPVVARNGWFEFDLTGTRGELDRLQATLEASDTTYELQTLVGTANRDALVTDRQRELLETAVREGYYEVPRECTLADLAEVVGVDKATASTVLRRGEATVVKWFLTGAEAKGGRVQ